MPLAIDTSRQFRSINELGNLVKVISLAPPSESEPDWLEWKREADLSDRRWHALIAKCIVGFANRDPVVAKQWAGGCSYMVIGAEPGNASGVAPVDNAILHAGISRFVRQTVRWNPQYIEYEGNQVLVITVEPPEFGDQIVAMLTSYQSHERGFSVCREGDVFIRRQGKTDHAVQEDFDMLVRRFAGGAERARGINVRALGTATAVPVECNSDVIAALVKRQERELLAPLERGSTYGFALSALLTFENRSPDEYRHQVELYLARLTSSFPSIAHASALKDRDPNLQLSVVNDTEHNFAGVRVEVRIEGDVSAYGSAEGSHPKMPKPPSKWGSEPKIFMPTPMVMPGLEIRRPRIDNSGPTSIKFPDVDLRPGQRVVLDPIHLVCDSELAGATLTANWTATSSSASGIARGEFLIKVSTEIFALKA